MKSFWRFGRRKSELQEELEAHLRMSIADRIARGESEEDARQAAMREFGNIPMVQEATRSMWGWVWLENLAQNLRYAVRRLLRSPGFTLSVVTMIAVGIAVTTAIFSVVYAVVLQPLPFVQPNQLIAVGAKPLPWLSLPTIQDWQRGGRAFQSIAAYGGWSPRIESAAGLGHANAELVSQNFARTLGLVFTLGHDFTQSGNESDCFGEAIVSYSYWQRMGGGSTLVDRTIQLDYRTYAVIGVLAPDMELTDMEALGEPSILTPIGCDPARSPQSRGDFAFGAIGRLYPGVSLREATAELQTRQRVLSREFPDYGAAFTPVLVPLADFISGAKMRAALFATLAACGMLLLIACANLINLLLARNMRRRSEFALRATLGATPWHLARQMLAENGLISMTGATIGIALSVVLVRAIAHLGVIHLPRLAHAKVNLPVLAFAGLLTVLIVFLLTVLPALRSLRPALLADLTYGGFRSSSVSFGLRRAGRFLVAVQLAMAFILVASSGWMVSSVFILLHQPLGFEPDHLLIASTDLRGHTRNAMMVPAKILAVLDQALADVRALPGVEQVAAANDKPLGGRVNRYEFCADVHPNDCKHPDSTTAPDVFEVTPGYFHTVAQEIYRGRAFNQGDDGQNHVAIVNRVLAAQQWPGEDPIGHRIYSGELHTWATVVGEVGDVHSYSLELAPVPNLYLPEADGPDTSMTIFVRTFGDPSQMDETIRRALRSDNEIEVRYVESMPELMAHQVAVRRFSMWVIVAFGALALALAIVGTYALLAYEVSVREREIGIRLALGSSRPAIVSLLVGQEAPWIGAGMTVGLLGAVLVGFSLRAEFYHAQATSVPVLLASSILLVLPALAAIAIPGRRASLLDPNVTLRQE